MYYLLGKYNLAKYVHSNSIFLIYKHIFIRTFLVPLLEGNSDRRFSALWFGCSLLYEIIRSNLILVIIVWWCYKTFAIFNFLNLVLHYFLLLFEFVFILFCMQIRKRISFHVYMSACNNTKTLKMTYMNYSLYILEYNP